MEDRKLFNRIILGLGLVPGIIILVFLRNDETVSTSSLRWFSAVYVITAIVAYIYTNATSDR